MEVKSVKHNLFMAVIRIMTGALFPIIVMPYVNRILNPTGVGRVEYANTIVNYFILFTSLGIPVYGVREIAQCRDSKEKTSKLFYELIFILIITNILAYIIYFLLIYMNQEIYNQRQTFFILGINIIFTTFGVEWFYQGIENQKYITIRAVIIRIISIIFLFSFVKNDKDYNIYAMILVLGSVGGNILNIINIKKYLIFDIEIIKKIKPQKHLKSILITLAAGLAAAIYTQIDILMIGEMIGVEYVGIYSLPMKFLRLSTVVITLVGSTLLPRLTYMFSSKDLNYKLYLNKTLKAILLYCCFLTSSLYILSKDIVLLFGGKNFELSIVTMKILAFVALFSGIAYFLGIIVLYSKKKDKIFLNGVAIACITNFILNYFLIKTYKQNGAAIATLFAEIVVIMILLIQGKKYFKEISILNINNLKYLICLLISIVFFTVFNESYMHFSPILSIFFKELIIIGIYSTILIFSREEETILLLKKIKKVILKNGN